MSRSLISSENSIWRNVLGVLSAAVLIPLGILLSLVMIPFARPIARTPAEVAHYLRDFIEGSGGEWDIDDFTSIPIADTRLDSIRERASRINLPISDEGLTELRELLAEAEALAAEHS